MSSPLLDRAEPGRFEAGLAELEIDDPQQPGRKLPTDVWYPAASASGDAAEAPHPFGRPHAARIGAPPAHGAFPLIVFSHGNSGLRRQSTFLTTHLARRGFVVAAPDHVGNTAFEMAPIQDAEELKRIHFEARRNRPRDLSAVLDRVLAGGPWAQADPARVAALGHSYGGWTAFKMPRRDARIRAVCALAPTSEPFVGRKAWDADELPLPTPALIVAGLDDVRVDLDDSTWPLFERLAAPSALVGLEGGDHYHFCDGIELLHTLHARRNDPRQKRPALAYEETLEEVRCHRALRGVVTHFFEAVFSGAADPCAALQEDALHTLDPALRRLDAAPKEAEAARG